MPRILIVDDDQTIRKMLTLAFSKEGFDVVTADNGRSAIRLLQDRTVDLVVTDIFMPEKDGLETICEMRLIRPNLKAIAISGGAKVLGPALYLSMAKELGAVKIMTKPVSIKVLIESVQEILTAEIVSCPLPAAAAID